MPINYGAKFDSGRGDLRCIMASSNTLRLSPNNALFGVDSEGYARVKSR